MKYIFPILVILSFLTLSFKESVIVGFYQVNKEYITKNFCVNKAKPELKCDGKCHLSKMLRKSKKTESESFPEGTLEYKMMNYIKSNFRLIYTEKVSFLDKLDYLFVERLNQNQFVTKIFHPPQV